MNTPFLTLFAQSEVDAAIGGAVALFVVMMGIAFLVSLVTLAGLWAVFVKAGKPGWAAIVPIYNLVVLLEITKQPLWFLILCFVPVVNLVIGLMIYMELAKAFGQGPGFGLGILLVPFVFLPMLGFGAYRYLDTEAADGSTTVGERSQKDGDPTAPRGFWARYSPNGEFPISTAASTAFHTLLFALIGLFAIQLLPPDREPPAVVSVRVGPDPEAAKGEGDDSLPGETLETAAPSETPETTPEVKQAEKVEEVKQPVIEEKGPKPAVQEAVKQDEQKVKDATRRSSSALDSAKEALQKNLAGKQPGGAGGSGATGRAARPARWILNFNFNNVDEYLRQLEGLGATVAFPGAGDKWKFYNKPSSSPKQFETRDLSTESRLYWVNEDPSMAKQLANALGLSGAEFITIFLPVSLEEKMLARELEYMNLEEEDIASTRFQCVSSGSGYDVKVISQIPK
jgi:hypothetical protein